MNNKICNLNTCFLCTNCTAEWKEVIALKRNVCYFKKGESIFKEGDKVKGIYFLYEGAVKVHKPWINEKELIIRFTKQGDILGHRGLASGDLYPVSATALIASKACFISNSFLEATLKVDHAFTYQLMQFYSVELQKAEMRMRNLALMEVNGRIAEALLELLNVFGTNTEGYITVPVTRQDIAAYAGTTYETVFKFFKILSIDKTISADGKSIKINEESKLKNIVKNAR